MLFNSLPFLAFALLVLAIYHHSRARPWAFRKAFLVLASWVFYATWSPRFLLLLIVTAWIDFYLGRLIHLAATARKRARRLLILSLVLNLGLLAFFKYGRFVWESIGLVAPLPAPPTFLAAVGPLGISFYTLHAVSYLVDVYRGVRAPSARFVDFALYLAFFPQLIAGPITRWNFFGPQLETLRVVHARRIDAALFLIASGFVKKVVCADSLGGFVDGVYAAPTAAGTLQAWLALYAYAFQIYFDFSGYTDIARGLALLLGFELPENFRHPYLAENPREFWRRWHITLSTWLRDYLYIALGGNRRGRGRTMFNLMATMVLGGLWHGASWTFALWGAYHGVLLVLHRLVGPLMAPALAPRWLRRTVTFHLVVFGWVLFRAGTMSTARGIFGALLAGRPLTAPVPIGIIAILLFGLATHGIALRFDRAILWQRAPRIFQGAVYAVVIVLVGLFSAQTGRFIYFAF